MTDWLDDLLAEDSSERDLQRAERVLRDRERQFLSKNVPLECETLKATLITNINALNARARKTILQHKDFMTTGIVVQACDATPLTTIRCTPENFSLMVSTGKDTVAIYKLQSVGTNEVRWIQQGEDNQLQYSTETLAQDILTKAFRKTLPRRS